MHYGDRPLGDTLTFHFQVPSAINADTPPTYKVYQEGGGAPIATGTMTVQDASSNGLYYATLTLSTGNGYAVNKNYVVRIAYALSAVANAADHTFTVRTDYWNTDPGDAAGKATSVYRMISQMFRWMVNAALYDGAQFIIYRDDQSTPMLSAQVPTSGVSTSRNAMS